MTRSHSQNGGISDNETIPSEHTSPCASLHLSRLDSSRLVLSSPSPRCLPPLPLPSSTSALVNIRPVKPTTPSPPRAVPMNSNPFFRSSKWAQHHHPRLASVNGVRSLRVLVAPRSGIRTILFLVSILLDHRLFLASRLVPRVCTIAFATSCVPSSPLPFHLPNPSHCPVFRCSSWNYSQF